MITFDFYIKNKVTGIYEQVNGTVIPLTTEDLLDEALDQAFIVIANTKIEVIESTTEVKVVIHQEGQADVEKYYIVGDDESTEMPIGQGFYTHKLSLLERTKLLEGVYCQSLTFTNALGKQWVVNGTIATQANAIVSLKEPTLFNINSVGEYLEGLYKTPIIAQESIIIKGLSEITSEIRNLIEADYTYSDVEDVEFTFADIGSLSVKRTKLKIDVDGNITEQVYYDNETFPNLTIYPKNNAIIEYEIVTVTKSTQTDVRTWNAKYFVFAVSNLQPTKLWTITSGINRVLDLAEPLFLGDTPRFVLNPIQAEKWKNTPLPETTMTQCTLREQLQHIGNYVHAQARLGGYLTESITYNDVEYAPGYYDNMIFFDEYGQEEESTLQGKPYVSNQIRHSINEYNTQIDTTAQNIVNTLDYGDGVVISPDAMHYKTIRAEGINLRLTDSEGNGLIATELPIYDIISVKCKAFNSDGTVFAENLDITPFIFEAHEYNSVLSSYGGGYPRSKSYAIYYTQGEKNIKGLFFKATTEPSDILGNYVSNYSIVNILEAVAPSYDWKNYVTSKFPYLAFQVSYIPFFETRYSHTDGYILGQDRKMPYTKIYNQSENVIEARFYGENIKGVAKRLGNQEATRTYYLGYINDVAKVGTMLDGYYISQAVTEFMPQSIRCTVGLTKHFNRLSQNVGINSTKRVAEVSERQAYNRNILLKNYICIGSNEELPLKTNNLLVDSSSTLQCLRGTGINEETIKLLSVALNTYSRKNSTPLSRIKAPIVSSAFGNCMTFSWKMKDNYSAGEEITELDNGYWQRDVAYSDYYGRAYYLDASLLNAIPIDSALLGNNEFEEAKTVRYQATVQPRTPVKIPNYILRKDSREIINVNVAIEYITNRQDLMLGSALASCNPWVSNSKKDANGDIILPRVYFFAEKLNQYENSISGKTPVWDDGVFTDPNETNDHIYVRVTNVGDIEYNSWCIAYPVTSETKMVYNEDTGEEEETTIYSGGEILIACNHSKDYYINNNIEFDFIYIKPYSDKYKDYEID